MRFERVARAVPVPSRQVHHVVIVATVEGGTQIGYQDSIRFLRIAVGLFDLADQAGIRHNTFLSLPAAWLAAGPNNLNFHINNRFRTQERYHIEPERSAFKSLSPAYLWTIHGTQRASRVHREV